MDAFNQTIGSDPSKIETIKVHPLRADSLAVEGASQLPWRLAAVVGDWERFGIGEARGKFS